MHLPNKLFIAHTRHADEGHSQRGQHRFYSVEHLSNEAIAAFVDDELSAGATRRAQLHLVHCAECRREVQAQWRTSTMVRGMAGTSSVHASADLLSRLNSIAQDACRMIPQQQPEHRHR